MTEHTSTSAPFKRVLAVAGVGLAGAVALSGCSLLESSDDGDSGSTEVSDEQVDAAADAQSGDCLAPGFLDGTSDEFTIDCSDPTAQWTITAIEADPGVTASGGDIADPQPIFDLCGEEVGALLPGKPLTDWNMIYDQATGAVDYLFCIEATDQPDGEGALLAVPTTGECFSSADAEWKTLPCDSAAADSTVANAVEFPSSEWAAPDVEGATAECGGTAYYELLDQFDRTTGLLCVE
ncbi:hypothetical protein [Glycomyces tenuis]|uniref:hypothetical protein n=1 Tax=Glycomyces tenuis TaxID=58116 RepID=UPI00040985E2|nr:hypothetical protein [Glycomyces tenuis]